MFHLLAQINASIAGNYRFEPYYTNQEINQLITYGRSLGMEQDLIHDLVCTGCRKQKPIPCQQMRQQMHNYQTVILPRGFPYRFQAAATFAQFKADVKKALASMALPIDDLRIHGSALRNPDAKDLDLLAVLTRQAYQEFSSTALPQKKHLISQQLQALQQRYSLGALDLLVVEDHTYYPNRPYLPLS